MGELQLLGGVVLPTTPYDDVGSVLHNGSLVIERANFGPIQIHIAAGHDESTSPPSSGPEPLAGLNQSRDRTRQVNFKLQDGHDSGFIEVDKSRGYTNGQDVDLDSLIHRE
ncbi:hypothetical protein F5X99DRAFT_75651 [Biscogniauxia marginata]|nr:hypothetical protein F5X99DRAFT_75651 [Biscogniauxia marginata]